MSENFTFKVHSPKSDLAEMDDDFPDKFVILAFPNQLSPQQVISRLRMWAFDIQGTDPDQSLEYRQMAEQVVRDYLVERDSG